MAAQPQNVLTNMLQKYIYEACLTGKMTIFIPCDIKN
jgi:hypothetical protein